MKKIIALMMLVFIGASTAMYAQESKSENRRAERKAQRDAEKAREKREEDGHMRCCTSYQQQKIRTGS